MSTMIRQSLLPEFDMAMANTRRTLAAVRSFVMNHMIHHRAQLGVYLRLNSVAVPGMYGPTEDERQ